MPKRSNDFQDLIELLERQLAPRGATVHASHLLRDARNGEEREVDIVIETKSGIHPVRIGVEVIDRKRPASSPWIEAMRQKHEDLAIDKSIAVSRSGFYRPALKKAEALRIDALTLREATELDWTAKIDAIPFIHLESFMLPRLTKVTVAFSEEGPAPGLEACHLRDLVLYTPSGTPRGSVVSFLEQILTYENTLKALRERAFSDAGTIVEGEIRLEKGSYALGPDGARYAVVALSFRAKCRKDRVEMNMQKGRYRDAAVVMASQKLFGRPIQIVLSQTKTDADPTISIRVKKR